MRALVNISSALFAISALLLAAPVGADDQPPKTDVWDVARGGQLYDKWWAVLGRTPPEQTHPAYPSEGKKSGADTWRCKECHGWDYRGAKGAYAKGSHYTGIGGLRDMVGSDPNAIQEILSGDSHGYTEDMIPAAELEKLAKFVSLGQMDMDLHVDRATNDSRGNAQQGATYYQTICAVCHGFDGKAFNFKDSDDPEYIGTIAHENPWEFIHKARFGQPGIPMISLIALPADDIADILAYSQTLPEK